MYLFLLNMHDCIVRLFGRWCGSLWWVLLGTCRTHQGPASVIGTDPKCSNNQVNTWSVTLITGNARVRKPHTLGNRHSASSSAPENQRNPTAASDTPMTSRTSLGIGADSKLIKRNGRHCHLKGICYYCGLTIDLPAPNCHNSWHHKPAVVGHATFTHHRVNQRWPWRGCWGTPNWVRKLTHNPSPQVCNLESCGYQHKLYDCIWSTWPHCRLGPNQCCSHCTQRFLFYLSLSPWFSLTLYQHSLIWVLPQISWTHLWLPCHHLYCTPGLPSCTVCLFDGKPATAVHPWVCDISVSFSDTQPSPLSPCDETAPIITHHFSLDYVQFLTLCFYLFKHWTPHSSMDFHLSTQRSSLNSPTSYCHSLSCPTLMPSICFWSPSYFINGRSSPNPVAFSVANSQFDHSGLLATSSAPSWHFLLILSLLLQYPLWFPSLLCLHSTDFFHAPIIPTDPLFPPHQWPQRHITWERTSQNSGRECHFIRVEEWMMKLLLDHMPYGFHRSGVLTSSQLDLVMILNPQDMHHDLIE